MWEFHKVSPESHRVSRDLFAQAVRLAPEFADAHIWLSRSQAGLGAYGWTDDPEGAFQEALAAALRGVQLDEQNPYAHYTVAVANVFGGQVAMGKEAAERAVALSPSFALGHLILGAARLYSGQPKEALDAFAHGFRLSPFDPQSFTWHLLAALAHYFAGASRGGGSRDASVSCSTSALVFGAESGSRIPCGARSAGPRGLDVVGATAWKRRSW
jgi:adenylate cyclase